MFSPTAANGIRINVTVRNKEAVFTTSSSMQNRKYVCDWAGVGFIRMDICSIRSSRQVDLCEKANVINGAIW